MMMEAGGVVASRLPADHVIFLGLFEREASSYM
jgi:hypothetical protein